MINNENPLNVKFTLEQLQQLDAFQDRSSKLQSEITIGTKALTALKNDTNRITKEKEYQEELLGKVNSQIEEANTRFSTLTGATLTASNALSEINQEIARRSDEINRKEMALKEREDIISTKENELISRETSVILREEDVDKSEKLLADKHAKIKAFAESI